MSLLARVHSWRELALGASCSFGANVCVLARVFVWAHTGHADRQLAVGARPVLEHEAVTGAVHRLQPKLLRKWRETKMARNENGANQNDASFVTRSSLNGGSCARGKKWVKWGTAT
eukprot:5773094-Pleurochrysis_carterae.AAC.1